MPRRDDLPTIGWREWIALPDLGIDWVKVKVDTGARSSSLHAYDVERFTRRGKELVRFRVHPVQRQAETVVEAEAPLHDVRPVRSSSGSVEMRPVIVTRVRLFERDWEIELTLTNRDLMGFRMLLGRQAVRGRFRVDPGSSYYAPRPPRRTKKKKKRRREAQ